MIGEVLVAHLVGDYILQSHWMATEKTQKWVPAIAHGVAYTLPFVFITQHPAALAVICITHIIIDRYRLAKHLSWLKNLIAPPKKRYSYIWFGGNKIVYDRRYDGADRAAGRPIHENMSVAPPSAKTERQWLQWSEARENAGYPKDTPAWLATWLMIITDNTLHILINIAAIAYFGVAL